MKNISKYFIKAHNKILTNGWYQGHYQSDTGQVCLLGAFDDTTIDDWSRIMEVLWIFGIENPAIWNDEPGRTQKEVLDLLDMATSLWLSNDHVE